VLIDVVLLPLPKIADIMLSANICHPAHRTVYDRVVDPNGEQHDPVFLTLFLEGRFDFLLNPAAFGRRFGQDEKRSVIHLNRFIDTGSKFIPDF